MFEIEYSRLCSVAVRHGYYNDSRCRDISVAPLRGGTQFGSGHARFVEQSDGGEIFGRMEWRPNSALPFRLGVSQTDGTFHQITDPDGLPEPGSSVLYFHNIGLNGVGSSFELQRAVRPLPVEVGGVSFELTTPVSDAEVVLRRRYPSVSDPLLVLKHQGTLARVDLSLTSLPEGPYELLVASQTVHAFYLLHGQAGQMLAVVEVFSGGQEHPVSGTGGILNQNDALLGPEFQITFEPREVLWRYVIFAQEEHIDLSGWQISSSDGTGLAFGAFAKSSRLGRDVWVATSQAAAILRERYITQLTLRTDQGDGVMVLPMPGPTSLTAYDGVGGIMAEVIVHL